jgi:hypothetical protein
MLAQEAKLLTLAAGALGAAVLLLNSRSGEWPGGLACVPKRQPRERISV